jgi:beta-hydroxylase
MAALVKRAADKLRAVLSVLLFVALTPLQRLMHRHSLMGDRPIFDPARFSWVPEIEAGWPAIRAELDRVLRHTSDIPNFQDISAENRVLTDDDRWKTFFFFAWGIPVRSNCARCPSTAALLERIPGMKSAFFSILMADKHLPAHRGPYAGVLRYHLGLKVPPGEGCRIRVGDRLAHWQEGRSLIFDDTYEHEVWNETDAVRVVLFVDIERPLPAWLARLNRLTIRLIARSSLVKPGFEKFTAWDRRLERVWPAGARDL